jgi:hypothetical protein
MALATVDPTVRNRKCLALFPKVAQKQDVSVMRRQYRGVALEDLARHISKIHPSRYSVRG